MTPYYTDDWLTVYQGDNRAVMAELPAESVHCVVTSPPYWGLRDYGDAGQLGLEATPEEYVANLVDVFREVRRVLRSDGTVWLNLGDTYSTAGGAGEQGMGQMGGRRVADHRIPRVRNGLKPKDLVGIPWRVAFALQADGWYLRSDIIWSKPNPMPESVTDRPTKSHEYLFLLSKLPRYYFDADAVRETFTSADDHATRSVVYAAAGNGETARGRGNGHQMLGKPEAGRNLRSVWTIATQPYPGAHYAVFPRKLVEPCIKAGSPKGVCPTCAAPECDHVEPEARDPSGEMYAPRLLPRVPATVLDPFAGSGTTGAVAQSLNRRAVLIDLNGDYLIQAMGRNRDIPLGLAG